jgi:hypothetical protein
MQAIINLRYNYGFTSLRLDALSLVRIQKSLSPPPEGFNPEKN